MSSNISLVGKKPAGWFSRRHQTPEEHNHAVNVYGNRRARKARRVERARLNAEHEQINCTECHTRHRVGRHQVYNPAAERLLKEVFQGNRPWSFYDQPQPTDMDLLADLDPAGTEDNKSLMALLNSQEDDPLAAEIDFLDSQD